MRCTTVYSSSCSQIVFVYFQPFCWDCSWNRKE